MKLKFVSENTYLQPKYTLHYFGDYNNDIQNNFPFHLKDNILIFRNP